MAIDDKIQQLDERIGSLLKQALADLREQVGRRVSEQVSQQLAEVSDRLPGSLVTAEQVQPLLAESRGEGRSEAMAAMRQSLAALDRQTNQAGILEALLDQALTFASRAALFLVREDRVDGWNGRGFQGSTGVSGLTIELAKDETWSRLADGRSAVTLSAGDCGRLCSRLESPLPTSGVLVPLVLRDRTAAALYADHLPGEGLDVAALQILTHVAAQAIETLPFRERSHTPTLILDAEATGGVPSEAPESWSPPPAPVAAPVAESVAAPEPAPAPEPAHFDAEPDLEAEPELELAAEEPEAEPELELAAEELAAVEVAAVELAAAEVAEEEYLEAELNLAPEPEAATEPEPEPEAAEELELELEIEEPAESVTAEEPEAFGIETSETEAVWASETVVEIEEEPAELTEEDVEGVAEEGADGSLVWEVEESEESEAVAEEAPPLVADGPKLQWEDVEVPAVEESPETPEPVTALDTSGLTTMQFDSGAMAVEEAAEAPATEPAAAEASADSGDFDADETVLLSKAPPPLTEPLQAPEPAPPTEQAFDGDETHPGGPGAAADEAFPPPRPVKATEVAPPSDIEGPGWAFADRPKPATVEDELHEKARRLARLLVSEIKLYNEEQVEEGRRNRDIYDRLKEDIDRSRQMYDDRVDERVRNTNDYFYQELVRKLAAGDPQALGI